MEMGAGPNTCAEDIECQDLPECSDRRDNDGDSAIDGIDPGCHTDGNAGNPASYDPNDDDERDGSNSSSSCACDVGGSGDREALCTGGNPTCAAGQTLFCPLGNFPISCASGGALCTHPTLRIDATGMCTGKTSACHCESSRGEVPRASGSCGDSIIQRPPEECDDGNARDADGCSSSCLSEIGICGDGVVQTLLGEQCEQSLHVPNDRYTCVHCRILSRSCGNGTVESPEECDEGRGNSDTSNARCRPDCSLRRCGDGILDGGEECDDRNMISGDGCDRFCRIEEQHQIAGFGGIRQAPGQASLPLEAQLANTACTQDAQCGEGGRCILGRCKGEPDSLCVTHEQCVSSRCVNGRCVACTADAECPTNLCRYGQCYSCRLDGDCTAGLRCLAGTCVGTTRVSFTKVPATTETGPEIIAIMAAGAAGGLAYMRRRKRA